jgi:hypothetical protein
MTRKSFSEESRRFTKISSSVDDDVARLDFPAADWAEGFEEGEALAAYFDVAIRHARLKEVNHLPAALRPFLTENFPGSAHSLKKGCGEYADYEFFFR